MKNINPWQWRLILSSASTLNTFGYPFASRELSRIEAELENKSPIRTRELINEGAEPQNIRKLDGALFIRIQNKWS